MTFFIYKEKNLLSKEKREKQPENSPYRMIECGYLQLNDIITYKKLK